MFVFKCYSLEKLRETIDPFYLKVIEHEKRGSVVFIYDQESYKL